MNKDKIARKNASLDSNKAYVHCRESIAIGDILPTDYLRATMDSTNLKKSLTRNENRDEDSKIWYEKHPKYGPFHPSLKDTDVVYEVEIRVTKVFRAKDLSEIKDGQLPVQQPILDSTDEFRGVA